MKTLEKGKERLKKICDVLRHETLEPAKKQADELIKEAEKKAQKIIADAENQAQQLIEEAKVSIEQERNVFQSSLQQAAKQGVEAMRQDIEHKLFNQQLEDLIQKSMVDPKIIANLINAIVKAIEKDGIEADITALIPKTVSAQSVNQLLASEVLKKLQTGSVAVGFFKGGALVKINQRKVTIDISEEALKELLANYIRKDFRKLIFAS